MSCPRSSTRLRLATVCRAVVLTVAAATVWFIGLAFVVSIVEEVTRKSQPDRDQHQLTFRNDGLPVWRVQTVRNHQYVSTSYHDLDGQAVEMPEKAEHARLISLVDTRISSRSRRATWRTDLISVSQLAAERCYFEDFGQRGQFTIFDVVSKQRIGFVGVNGFSSTPLAAEQQFPTRAGDERVALIATNDQQLFNVGLPWAQAMYNAAYHGSASLLIEPGGRRVHLLNLQKRTSRVIHDGEPVWSACFDLPVDLKTDRLRIVLRTEEALRVITPSEPPEVAEVVRLPQALQRAAILQWVRTTDGPLFVEPLFMDGWKLTWATNDGAVVRERVVPQRLHIEVLGPDGAWVLPLFQIPLFGDIMLWAMSHPEDSESRLVDHRRATELGLTLARDQGRVNQNEFAGPLAALHISVMLWCVLAVRRLRRCDGSIGEQIFWGAWTLACGLPGYLAFRVSASRRMAALGRPSEISNLKFEIAKDRTAEGGHPTRLAINDRLATAGFATLTRLGLPPDHAALVMKELRLAVGAGAVACLAFLLVVAKFAEITGFGWMRTFISSGGVFPFLTDGFAQPFGAIAVLLAVGLAVLQTATESRGGAWLFLLHRPVSRRAILCSKLAAGLSVLLVCSALPIVLYGAWAARPGTHASPFEWSMTTETWRLWWAMPPLYLGTLLTMWRPARWLGTRSLPCVAGFAWLMAREVFGVWLWPTWQEFAVVTVVDAVFVACLLLIVREREYP